MKSKKYYLLFLLPFFYMDLCVRLLSEGSRFYPSFMPGANVFTLLYGLLFIGLARLLGRFWGRLCYGFFFCLVWIFFFINLVYYHLTKYYFSFSLLQMASEGKGYVLGVLKDTPFYIWIMAGLGLLLGFLAVRFLARLWEDQESNLQKKRKRPGKKQAGLQLVMFLLVFCLLHLAAPWSLGKAYGSLKWKNFRNPRNVYNSFSDTNKCMRVSGLCEYTVRDFYITYLKPKEKLSQEDQAFLDQCFDQTAKAKKNAYTGRFAGKNVIFLQLEGMDQWLLNEKDTPNLYVLKQESIDFTDHYSMYTGGGSTFNSEFSVNTGYTTPTSYTANVYTMNQNQYPGTMAELFKKEGYRVNAYHMNSGEFYSRGINYKSWGFDGYHSLINQTCYKDTSYELDRELILNQAFYQDMFQGEEPFVHYLISYTPHTPFTFEEGVGQMLAEDIYGAGAVPQADEEEVVRLEVGETDRMVGLLMEALKENGLYENTVIVAYADHYLYTIQDKSVLDRYKITGDNRINQTPFFIWSAGGTYEKVDRVTMQVNILPTVLNLWGIAYNPSYYLGQDALAEDYEGLAFFADGSWYDGKVYYDGDKVSWQSSEEEKTVQATEEKKANQPIDEVTDSQTLDQKKKLVANLRKKNDLTLKFDYLRNYKE